MRKKLNNQNHWNHGSDRCRLNESTSDLSMDHIVSELRAPNGVRVKLLGERHSKSPDESLRCNPHINDPRVTDILFESGKLSKYSRFMLTMVRKAIGFDETASSIRYARDTNLGTRFSTRFNIRFNTKFNTEAPGYDLIINKSETNQMSQIIYNGFDDETEILTIEPMIKLKARESNANTFSADRIDMRWIKRK
jgi:hypothetical protein